MKRKPAPAPRSKTPAQRTASKPAAAPRSKAPAQRPASKPAAAPRSKAPAQKPAPAPRYIVKTTVVLDGVKTGKQQYVKLKKGVYKKVNVRNNARFITYTKIVKSEKAAKKFIEQRAAAFTKKNAKGKNKPGKFSGAVQWFEGKARITSKGAMIKGKTTKAARLKSFKATEPKRRIGNNIGNMLREIENNKQKYIKQITPYKYKTRSGEVKIKYRKQTLKAIAEFKKQAASRKPAARYAAKKGRKF